jgi:U3 small nucleolar RNA-associated protein 11
MMSSKTDQAGRKLADRGNKILNHDVVKLLKTQDAGYLRTMAQKSKKERERIEQGYVLGREGAEILTSDYKGGKQQHIIFVGTKEEQKNFISQSTSKRKLQESNKAYADRPAPQTVEDFHSKEDLNSESPEPPRQKSSRIGIAAAR